MSIFYHLNKYNKVCDKKLILINLYPKFIIRNRIEKSFYLIENGKSFFNIKKTKIKNRLKFIKKTYSKYLLKKKAYNKLARIYNIQNPNISSTNTQIINNFNRKLKKKIIKNKVLNTVLKKRTNSSEKQKKINKTYLGFSFYGKPTLFKHKKYSKFQILFFLKKKIFINFLKHRIFLLNFVLKLFTLKIQFSGFILKIKKGGCICTANNILTVKAFVPKSHTKRIFKKKLGKVHFLKLFQNLSLSTSNLTDIKTIYFIYLFYRKKYFLNLNKRSRLKMLFPLYVGCIKKIRKKRFKKKTKQIFKLKKRKIFNILKKRKLYYKKKLFLNIYNIVFVSKKKAITPVKVSKDEKFLIAVDTKYKEILMRLSRRIGNLKSVAQNF